MLSQRVRHSQRGFTLVEVLVVVLVISLLTAVAVVGIKAITGRGLQAEVDNLTAWIAAAGDSALLSGTSYGIARDDDQLVVVAPVGAAWYRVAHIEPWSIPDGMQLSEPQPFRLSNGVADSNNSYRPFAAFGNSGLLQPAGQLTLAQGDATLALSWAEGRLEMLDGANAQ